MISKNQYEESINKQTAEVARCLETKIDNGLLRGERSFSISINNTSSHIINAVATRLIQLYTNGGWTVKRNKGSCQRDGDWDYLEFS